MALRMLVVEDEADIREFYRALFEDTDLGKSFEVTLVDSVTGAIRALDKTKPEVVLLDWNLGGQDGMAVLEAVRANARTRAALVFVVTSLSTKDREVEALNLGADDFLAKPFDVDVLQARLRNLVKRRELPVEPSDVVTLASIKLEMSSGRLSIAGKALAEPLHNKEALLLRVFLKRPNMIHSAPYLWETVWGYESPDFKHTLQVTLSNLRKKLGATWGPRLENIKDRGYQLTAP